MLDQTILDQVITNFYGLTLQIFKVWVVAIVLIFVITTSTYTLLLFLKQIAADIKSLFKKEDNKQIQ